MSQQSDFSKTKQTSTSKGNIYDVPPTKRTPHVYFDLDDGILKLTGRSLPQYANDFYFPLMRQIDEYISKPANPTKLIFDLEYIDSSSSQFILAIIYRMKKVKAAKKELQVIWNYMEDDQDILEVGETYAELSGLDFIFKGRI